MENNEKLIRRFNLVKEGCQCRNCNAVREVLRKWEETYKPDNGELLAVLGDVVGVSPMLSANELAALTGHLSNDIDPDDASAKEYYQIAVNKLTDAHWLTVDKIRAELGLTTDMFLVNPYTLDGAPDESGPEIKEMAGSMIQLMRETIADSSVSLVVTVPTFVAFISFITPWFVSQFELAPAAEPKPSFNMEDIDDETKRVVLDTYQKLSDVSLRAIMDFSREHVVFSTALDKPNAPAPADQPATEN